MSFPEVKVSALKNLKLLANIANGVDLYFYLVPVYSARHVHIEDAVKSTFCGMPSAYKLPECATRGPL